MVAQKESPTNLTDTDLENDIEGSVTTKDMATDKEVRDNQGVSGGKDGGNEVPSNAKGDNKDGSVILKKVDDSNTDQDIHCPKHRWFKITIISVVVLLIAVAAYYYISRKPSQYFRGVKEFKDEIEIMKSEFPSQNEALWKMLINGGSRYLNKINNKTINEQSPLSYTIAGYANTRTTVNCFASRLSHAFTTTEGQKIDSLNFTSNDDRGNLDDKIKTSLRDDQKFLIVNDFDKLKFDSAQLFMSYIDEYNKVAHYPESVFILTTILPFAYEPKQSRRDDEEQVTNYFISEVWNETHVDLTEPLWSRVGDGLLLFKEEKKIPCS